MPAKNVIKATWRDKEYLVPICFDGAKFETLLNNWPDGVIDIRHIYDKEHQAESTDEEKLAVVKYVFKKANESIFLLNVAMAKYYIQHIE